MSIYATLQHKSINRDEIDHSTKVQSLRLVFPALRDRGGQENRIGYFKTELAKARVKENEVLYLSIFISKVVHRLHPKHYPEARGKSKFTRKLVDRRF